MDRIGLKVEQNRDGTIRIYQPPGDRNALGRIRFNFPNKFLAYQHDTPDKYLSPMTSAHYATAECGSGHAEVRRVILVWRCRTSTTPRIVCKRCSVARRSTSTSRLASPTISLSTAFVDEAGACRSATTSMAATPKLSRS